MKFKTWCYFTSDNSGTNRYVHVQTRKHLEIIQWMSLCLSFI